MTLNSSIEMKLKKHDQRIAIRLPSQQRERINQLILKGQNKNLSQFLRTAIQEFLTQTERGDDSASE